MTAPTTRETADHAELARLAEAATPGPWTVFDYDCGDKPHYDHNGPCPSIQAPFDQDCAIVHWDGFKQEYWSSANGDQRRIEANAAFIAAANPARVLALLSEIAALRGERDKEKRDADNIGSACDKLRILHRDERLDLMRRATQAERQRDEAVEYAARLLDAADEKVTDARARLIRSEARAFLANQGAD